MTTRVVNARSLPADSATWPPDHVYIGRAMPSRGLRRSPWANPFRVAGTMRHDDAVRAYDAYLQASPHLLERVGELRGKVLVCWCKPHLACHGDLLARLADER